MPDAPLSTGPVAGADPPAAAPPPVDPPVADGTPPAADEPKIPRTPEEFETELAKVRREAANNRVKLREAEAKLREADPIVKAAQEAAEAKKDGETKALERAQAAEKAHAELQESNTRLELAVHYRIEPEDIDLIGAGTREEMDSRAQRIAAKNAAASKAAPPPSDRPIESLRPGAAPEPPRPADDSYPADWTPSYLREKESRSFNGQ